MYEAISLGTFSIYNDPVTAALRGNDCAVGSEHKDMGPILEGLAT